MRHRSFLFAASLLSGLALSCAGAVPAPVAPEIPRPPAPPPPPPAAPKGPDPVPAQVLAMVDDESASPYFARRADGALLFYSAKGRWLTRAIGADGAPKGSAPLDVAALGADVSMASVKALGDGYAAVWIELVAQNRVIKLLSLDVEGKPRGEPLVVAQVTEDVSWVDVLPNAKGGLLLWEVPHDDRSDLFVVPVAGGKVEGAPTLAAHDVIGWEAEATERGAAIAIVAADGATAPPPAPAPRAPATPSRSKPGKASARPARAVEEARGTKVGRVFVTEVDVKGKAGPPSLVSGEPTAEIDVTLAEIGGKYVIAWTDERNIDACVYLAAVDPGGHVLSAPHRATAPFGEQALVSLVAEAYGPDSPHSKRGLLAWEDQLRTPRDGRLIHLATVGPDGQLGKERGGLVFSASGPPDIGPDGDGFAAVTLAPVHEIPEGVEVHPQQGVKGDAPVWPAFVRFGADLTVTASEPLRADPFTANDGVPYLTRALSCRSGACTTLGMGAVVPAKGAEPGSPPDAQSPAVPAPIALLSFPTRPSPWKAPAFRENDEAPPRAESVTALFDGEHLARVASADVPGGGTLVAWVKFVIDTTLRQVGKRKGKAREEESASAVLTVRSLAEGKAPGKPVVVSKKAVSAGGLSLAAAPAHEGKKPETALAWVARERGEAQLFVAKLGPDGDKIAQKAVTTVSRKGKTTSDASDAAIAYAGGEGSGGDGWITAWVDTRDGNAEIYVAKLDKNLNKTVQDTRITSAPGDSVEVQIAVRGKDVFLVWSDARANPDAGNGDIYLAKLDAVTLKKTGPEAKLFASATHSRTPQITPAGKGFLVSWIEEGQDPRGAGEAGAQAGLRIAMLDERGMLVGLPQIVRGAEGQSTVTSGALACQGRSCRGVLTSAMGEALTLGAFQINPGSPAGQVKTIAALTGASQDASPVFSGPAGTSLFFADDAVGGTGRVRWMKIQWP